jgi:hypothetical protein
MVVFCSLRAQTPASLAATGWKGTMSVPYPIICILKFEKDTVRIVYADQPTIMASDMRGGMHSISGKDSASIEDMTYQFHADTLWLKKVQGGSPCNPTDPGVYKVKVSDGKLTLLALKDA